MTHDEIIAYCLQKPGAYLTYPFDPVFPYIKVKAPSQEQGRGFANPFVLRGEAVASFNCTPAWGEFWRGVYPGAVTRGWHCPPVQQPHVNTVKLDGAVPDDEILRMIDHAYDTVVAKLPKYQREELRRMTKEEE